ncbi:YchJ family metal-binding protein [Limnohabitans sp. Rim8]|jgi:uncharacterized protein YchJ|uniref:YchJ family metal-binding protein n=1 Tax=Limnohabitans sp. Rim8 TaxID=1100718 RepID=UPI00345C3595
MRASPVTKSRKVWSSCLRPLSAAPKSQHEPSRWVNHAALNKPPTQQHERSRFVREDGRWFYVDGDEL